jgi:hypothetical protein
MKVTGARKATGMALTAFAILALAASSAFAGTDNSRGYNKDSGYKLGNDNKKTTYTCPDGYWLDYAGNWTDGWAYDLNQDSEICVGYADGHYNFMDDTTNS